MANAIAGVGTTFERWSGSAWQFIAEINAIEGPTMNKENIEVTALDTDGGYDEFITGFMEGGTLTLNMNFTRSGYELMKQDFEIDVARDYRITLPDDEDTTLEFEGLVIEIPLTMEAEDKLTVDVTIQVTGEVALGGDQSWEQYWETNSIFYATSRSGSSFIDEKGNDASILTPVIHNEQDSAAYLSDNGSLDIGNDYDLTFGCFVEIINDWKDASQYIMGKGISTSATNGRYSIYRTTDGYLGCFLTSSGGTVSAIDNENAYGKGMQLVIMEIIQGTKTINFYINNILKATNTFTGTFNSLNNDIRFLIGAGQNHTSGSITVRAYTDVADSFFVRRILSPTEKANILNRVYSMSLDHLWIPSYSYMYDVVGTTHLNKIAELDYNIYGSHYYLDYGYSQYSHPILIETNIPKKLNGDSIVISETSDYFLKYNVDGDLTQFNLADAIIEFAGDEWDRSNTDRFNANARDEYMGYDASNPKRWHSKHLNNLVFRAWSNADYRGINFVEIDDYSYASRKKLLKVFSLNENLSGGRYNSCLVALGDNIDDNVYKDDFIEWEEVTDSIIAIRGDKILKYNDSLLQLSINKGATYSYSIAVPGTPSYVQMGYICANGNVVVASDQHIYLSQDNLSTIAEVVPKGIDGNNFTPSTYDNFFASVIPTEFTIGAKTFICWGNYSAIAGTEFDNINIWCTDDNFVTLKSIYKAGITAPGVTSRHIHQVIFNPNNNTIWIQTGDGTDDCWIIEGTYDPELDTWSFAIVEGDNDGGSATHVNNTWYKISGIVFNGSDIYWSSDSDNSARRTIIKCAYADFGDYTKYEKVFNSSTQSTMASYFTGFGFIAREVSNYGKIIYSDDLTQFSTTQLYSILNRSTTGVMITPMGIIDGWVYCHIYLSTETYYNWYLGNCIRIKLTS